MSWPLFASPFHPAPTGPIVESLYALRFTMVNLYLIQRGDTIVAFDAATGGRRLAAEWRKLPIGPQAVQSVFLTHTDSDHVGGLALMPDAQVYLGEGAPAVHSRRVPIALADGQTVQVGDLSVQTIATPGHRAGSVCYLVDGRWLFTGDTLALRRGKAGPFVRLLNDDSAAQERSLRRLAQLQGIELVCTGHSGICRQWDQAAAAWREAAS